MNSISISGNLGKDCETRHLPDGTTVVSFSVADSQGKDKNSIWWNCALFGKRGESLAQYLTKGQTVTVVGNVTERAYTDKNGTERKSIDVRVNDIALQGGRKEAAPAAPTRTAPSRAAPQPDNSGFDNMDDDIPFATSSMYFDMTTSKQRRINRYV
jgi:single-strand DNA-binding protein